MNPRTPSWTRFGRSLLALTAFATAAAIAGCDGGTFTGTFNFDGEDFSFSFDFPAVATANDTQTADVTGVTQLRVRTKNGLVRVGIDDTRTDAQIRSFKFANASSDSDAQDILSQITITIQREGDNNEILVVSAEFPDIPDAAHGNGSHEGDFAFFSKRTGASFRILLPAGLALDLETSNGHVAVTDNAGAVKARTSNGGILVDGNAGNIDLATDNGSIEARKITGNALIRTNNGDIALRATIADDGSIDAETVNGFIGISVPTSTKAALDLHTVNGRVDTDFTGFAVTDENSSRKDVTATLNGGGGTIHGKTTNGGVQFEGL